MAGIEIDLKSTDHQQLYKHGVRAYVLQDYDSAVRAFSRCLELLTSEYNDDQHDSLGDVYLYYGKSLLGLSRQELEPLNENIIKNNEENDEEDDDNDEQDEEGDEDSGGGGGGGDGDAKQEKPTEENGTAVNGDDKKPETNSNKDNDDDDKPTEEKEEDELTDLQVAWEVLELAKQIFSKRVDGDGGGEGRDNLAETLIVLGEISLESGNFQIGIDDIRRGLEIQEQLYKNDSRTLAETYYKLGTALSTNQQIDAAIEQYQKSLDSLQLRLDNLKKTTTNDEDDVKDEIKEIEDLMPEIEEKITDMKSYKLEMLKKEETSADQPESSSTKPATDISHLVKRKRPAEDGASCSGDHVPTKKPSL